ncbi:hypothetical protein SNEBB_003916 [Seison nebaliae]|nr:hypothetical protein SNEBB_003916 [Seison nebaliae]
MILILISIIHISSAVNIDVISQFVTYNGVGQSSHFGYTLKTHSVLSAFNTANNITIPSYARNLRKWNFRPEEMSIIWILVGAPKAQTTYQDKGVSNGGAVFRCSIFPPYNCNLFDSAKSRVEKSEYENMEPVISDNELFGASIQTSNDLVLICAPHRIVQTEKLISTKSVKTVGTYAVQGGCDLNKVIVHHDVEFKYLMYNIQPCEGSSSYQENGQCLAGFSSIISKNGRNDRITLGLPGSLNYAGGVASATNNTKFSFANAPKPNSYLGFAMTSGSFFSVGSNDVVTSAPRANSFYGVVYIFGFYNSTDSIKTETNLTLYGKQFAAFFGYSLAVGDFNNDKFDDLVISSPLYRNDDGEEVGAIHIYLQIPNAERIYGIQYNWAQPKPLNETPTLTIEGVKSQGWFGATVQTIGDINRDGYDDLAVAAPFEHFYDYELSHYDEENFGRIYIFMGSANGLHRFPHQIINSKKLDLHQSMFNQIPEITTIISINDYDDTQRNDIKGLGFALHGGNEVDLDFNGYPDLIASAVFSDQTFWFKSFPVARVQMDLSVLPKNINLSYPFFTYNPLNREKEVNEKEELESLNEFIPIMDEHQGIDFEFCHHYTSPTIDENVYIDLYILLDAKPMRMSSENKDDSKFEKDYQDFYKTTSMYSRELTNNEKQWWEKMKENERQQIFPDYVKSNHDHFMNKNELENILFNYSNNYFHAHSINRINPETILKNDEYRLYGLEKFPKFMKNVYQIKDKEKKLKYLNRIVRDVKMNRLQKTLTNERLTFLNGKSILKIKRFPIQPYRQCNRTKIFVYPNLLDKHTDFNIRIHYQLSMNPYSSTYLQSDDSTINRHRRQTLLPTALPLILDKLIPNTLQLTVPILKNCGTDKKCIPELNYVGRVYEKIKIQMTKPLKLHLQISNDGEDAYLAKAFIKIPNGLEYRSIAEAYHSSISAYLNLFVANYNEEKKLLTLNLGNPMESHTTLSLEIHTTLTPNYIFQEPFVLFSINLTSSNSDIEINKSDNFGTIRVPVEVDCNLEILTKTIPEQLWYSNDDVYEKDVKIKAENIIGPEFLHIYEIHNKGPSTALLTEMYLDWPMYDVEGKYVMYLLEAPEIGGVESYCESSPFINPQQYNIGELMNTTMRNLIEDDAIYRYQPQYSRNRLSRERIKRNIGKHANYPQFEKENYMQDNNQYHDVQFPVSPSLDDYELYDEYVSDIMQDNLYDNMQPPNDHNIVRKQLMGKPRHELDTFTNLNKLKSVSTSSFFEKNPYNGDLTPEQQLIYERLSNVKDFTTTKETITSKADIHAALALLTQLKCNETSVCVQLKCYLKNMKKNDRATVRLRGRLYRGNSIAKQSTIGIRLTSSLKLNIKTVANLENGNRSDQTVQWTDRTLSDFQTTLFTSAFPEQETNRKLVGVTELWIVALGVTAGIALLMILIVLLWCCGFFKRKRTQSDSISKSSKSTKLQTSSTMPSTSINSSQSFASKLRSVFFEKKMKSNAKLKFHKIASNDEEKLTLKDESDGKLSKDVLDLRFPKQTNKQRTIQTTTTTSTSISGNRSSRSFSSNYSSTDQQKNEVNGTVTSGLTSGSNSTGSEETTGSEIHYISDENASTQSSNYSSNHLMSTYNSKKNKLLVNYNVKKSKYGTTSIRTPENQLKNKFRDNTYFQQHSPKSNTPQQIILDPNGMVYIDENERKNSELNGQNLSRNFPSNKLRTNVNCQEKELYDPQLQTDRSLNNKLQFLSYRPELSTYHSDFDKKFRTIINDESHNRQKDHNIRYFDDTLLLLDTNPPSTISSSISKQQQLQQHQTYNLPSTYQMTDELRISDSIDIPIIPSSGPIGPPIPERNYLKKSLEINMSPNNLDRNIFPSIRQEMLTQNDENLENLVNRRILSRISARDNSELLSSNVNSTSPPPPPPPPRCK